MNIFENQTQDQEDTISSNDSYLSISDLMSALVMILCFFLLIFMYDYTKAKNKIDKVGKEIEALENEMSQLDQLEVTMLDEIKKKLGESNLKFIAKDNNIEIAGDFNFEKGKSNLSEIGKKNVRNLIIQYSKALFSSEQYMNSVNYIQILGYSSRLGDDLNNMNLSLLRAYEIFRFAHQLEDENFIEKEAFLEKLIVAGRGELDASVEPSEEDLDSDRKIVFKIIFATSERKSNIFKHIRDVIHTYRNNPL
jgi:outer membrane protein OmpA-like peptidoglycan-associated protein